MTKLYLYGRGSKPTWYIGGYPTGKAQRSTGLFGPEAKKTAEKLLVVEQKEIADAAAARGHIGPMTVARWAPIWLAELRKNSDIGSLYSAYETIVNCHILPVIGNVELAKVCADDVVAVLNRAKVGGAAHRTRRNIYRRLKQMLRRAVPKYLAVNPCLEIETERRQVLPKNLDRNPEWRDLAVFIREELEGLLFDERVAEDRRMFYALAFLLGIRLSECSALSVTSYVPKGLPLGKMLVAWSWNTEERRRKELKTGVSRVVPVHGLLAELIREWLAPGGGRERLVAMCPGKDMGLLVPSREGGHRNRHSVLAALKRDLKLLGLRDRRVHDTRRTFISLIMDNGGHKDLCRFITHGRPKTNDAFDLYNEPAWGPLCLEVLKLAVARPAPAAGVVPIRKYANSADRHLQGTYSQEKPEQSSPVAGASAIVPCNGQWLGHPRALADIRGNLKPSVGGGAPMSGQIDTPADQSRPLVSSHLQALIAAALNALEANDVAAAKDILRRGIP